MNPTTYEVKDGVAVICLSNPPVNALSLALRAAIVSDVQRAIDDPQVQAVVLAGAGSVFSGGADVREFGSPDVMAHPALREVCNLIDWAPKPIVAAVHGQCLGGGFELALACHYRVTADDASVGLPEVKLGVLPGCGGTQRLPRAVGLTLATNMIVSGEPVPAALLAAAGAFDKVAPAADLLSQAVGFARDVARQRPIPRLRNKRVDPTDSEAFLGLMRTTLKGKAPQFPAPHKCLDVLEAAVGKSFDEVLTPTEN